MINSFTIPSDGGFYTGPNSNLTIIDAQGFGNPDPKRGHHEYSNAHGGQFLAQYYKTRRLAIKMIMQGTDAANLEQLFSEFSQAFSFLNEEKLFKFTTLAGLDLQCYVMIADKIEPRSLGPSTDEITVELDSADPLLYSQSLHSASGGVVTLTGAGIALPMAVPFALSGNVTGVLSVINAGNMRVYPESVIITGPGTNFTMQNKTTGKTLFYNNSLLLGDSITIDMKRHTAIKNGSENVYGGMSGDWWDLYYGNNDIALTVGAGDTSATMITISWRDAYLGRR